MRLQKTANPTIKTYSMPKVFHFIFYSILFFTLIIIPVDAWLHYILDHSCQNFYFVSGFIVIELFYLGLTFWYENLRTRKFELSASGIALIQGEKHQWFLRWGEITRLKGGVGGLVLLDKTGKIKIPLLSMLKDYEELRERIFAEIEKRMAPAKSSLTYRWFPFRQLTLDTKGLQIKTLFQAKVLAWKEVATILWSFKYSIGGGNHLSSVKIIGKDGWSFKTYGPALGLAEMYLSLKKYFKKYGKYSAPLTATEKPSKGFYQPLVLGFLWMTLPGLYKGYFMNKGPSSFWFWLMALFCLGVFAFSFVLPFQRESTSALEPSLKQPFPWKRAYFKTAIFILGGFLAWNFWWMLGKIQLALVKRDIVQAGYSTSPPGTTPKLPDDQNAVYFLRKAVTVDSAKTWMDPAVTDDKPINQNGPWIKPFYKKMNELDFLSDFRKSIEAGTLTPEKITYARKLLKLHAESLALIHEAAEIGKFDWGQDFSIPWFTKDKLPRIAFLLSVSRLVACEAYIELKDRQYEKAFKSLKAGFGVGEASRASRFLIGEMIGEAIPKIMLDVLRDHLPQTPQLLAEQQLLPLLQPWEKRKGFLDTMQFEFLSMHGSLDKMSCKDLANYFQLASRYSPSNKKLGFLFYLESFFYRPFLELDLASALNHDFQILKGYVMPFKDQKEYLEKTTQIFQKTGWAMGQSYVLWGGGFSMNCKALECAAYSRLAHAALEARVFHEKNKRWPDALWELETGKTRNDYLDPFNDNCDLKVMRYRNGILIYSVGPDGVDNQGKPQNLSTNSYITKNLTWILEQ